MHFNGTSWVHHSREMSWWIWAETNFHIFCPLFSHCLNKQIIFQNKKGLGVNEAWSRKICNSPTNISISQRISQYPGSHQHVQAWTPALFMVWWNCLVICQCFCFLTPLPFTVDSWVRGHPLNEEGICGDPWKGTRREQKMESPWLQRQRRQTQGLKDRPNHLLSTMTSF